MSDIKRYSCDAHRHPLAASIPWAWGNALKRLHGLFPEAFIAGGALRDLYFPDVDVKDIDIFVRSHGASTRDDLERCLGVELRPMIDLDQPGVSEYETWNSEVRAIYNGAFCDEFDSIRMEDAMLPLCPELQIIALNDARTPRVRRATDHDQISDDGLFRNWVIDDFDLGFSQIWFDGYAVGMTEAFYRDIRNHTVTLIRDHTKERSLKRLARLSERLGVMIEPAGIAEAVSVAKMEGVI